jgi:hypothetical protein
MYLPHEDYAMVWPDPPVAEGTPIFVITSDEGISITDQEAFGRYLNDRADSCCDHGAETADDRVFVKLPANKELIPVVFEWGTPYTVGDDDINLGVTTPIVVRILPEKSVVYQGSVFVPDH